MQPTIVRTRTITTPLEGKVVTLKTLITGAEREDIESAATEFITTKDGKSFEVKDMAKLVNAQRHKMLRICVVDIDKDPTNCLERMRDMLDEDYSYIVDEVEKDQKKIVQGRKNILQP